MGHAILVIDHQFLEDFGVGFGEVGRMDGDTWIEPERRYNLAALREKLPIEPGWHIWIAKGVPVVYPDLLTKSISIIIEGDSLPDAPRYKALPRIWPEIEFRWNGKGYQPVVVDFNMREIRMVEAGQW